MQPEGAPEGYQYYLFMGTAPEEALDKTFPGITLRLVGESDEERQRREKASQPGRVFYGEFDLKDHHFHSEYGDQDGRPCWFLTVTRDQEVVRREEIPMLHRPTFGPDVDDVGHPGRNGRQNHP